MTWCDLGEEVAVETELGARVGLVSNLAERRTPEHGDGLVVAGHGDVEHGQVEGLLAHEDHRAVDATGHERRDLLRRHGHHRLVQQPQPLCIAAHDDERAALPHPAERQEVGLAEASPEGEHLPEQFMRLLRVPDCGRRTGRGRRRDQRPFPQHHRRPGSMFWLSRKRLSGS